MDGRSVLRYSEAFKLQIVSEIESGQLSSISEANRRYGITGTRTVRLWLEKYGRTQQLPRVVRVETPDERDRVKELQKENERLKRALADAHMKTVLYESWFEIACRDFGVKDVEAYKKKLDRKP